MAINTHLGRGEPVTPFSALESSQRIIFLNLSDRDERTAAMQETQSRTKHQETRAERDKIFPRTQTRQSKPK